MLTIGEPASYAGVMRCIVEMVRSRRSRAWAHQVRGDGD